ncbi:type II toxin-antitoxin system RelE/ParE family toxin [Desulfobulbus alkaliphilus]|uniref:type II toxin-antitoxin system RelE/ParE family toxin n=1 Tax=Desulfobulbus alkaliphilus TaxID=869814 RepID=UPI0019629D5B|nr:type II toxin-antitoxin system RelE/ParE family toxin [Desulfobulbus alkaliphilus]MBM9536213.1 type II toxin-antitoxin system RelE/ParE family toxin [Desulfobulbus alkaliphilus]
MIKSFGDKKTQLFYEGNYVKNFQAFARQAEKRLRILEAADSLESLMRLPSNHCKALSGRRKGQFSIRINDQWRLCFEWHLDGAYNVQIIDYH